MTTDLAASLLEVHRAGAAAATLREALQSATSTLRRAFDASWVVAVVWEPVTSRVRCSVVDGVSSDEAAELLRLAGDRRPTDAGPRVVASLDHAGDMGELLSAGGACAGLVVPLMEEPAEPLGMLVIATDAMSVANRSDVADLAAIGITVAAEVVRATRDETNQRRAMYDAATGLPGALVLDAVLQAADPEQEIALLLVSVDQLQTVARSFGRAAGNELLRKMAARLMVAGGSGGWSAYRLPRGLGVLTQGPAGTAAEAADIILESMREPWVLGRRSLRSTCRIGMAVCDDGVGGDVLVERAETALEAASTSRGEVVVTYGPHLAASAHERLVFETLLQEALRGGELQVRYQPQVDVASGRITGAEALVRWQRPSGLVTPDRFIPAAESSGVIVDIDRWVLHEACLQGQRWAAEGRPPLRVACNVSSLTLAAPGFASTVLSELASSGLPADLLEVEITESLSLFEGEEAVRELTVLRDHGVHVAIDDFGTGYSNVGRLRELPVDRVKIDQSFVRDISGQSGSAICSVIIGLARTLELDVIAEGVETDEQLGVLSSLGCAEFQGYLASPPVDAEAFALLLPA